jgi:hypothetical protein
MNKNTILGIALLVLLGIYFLVERDNSSSSVREKLVEINKDAVSALRFTKAGTTTELTKVAGRWLINNYPVDQSTLDLALNSLSDMKLSRFVTDNTERQEAFEVDDKRGIKVTVSEGEKTSTFYLGKQASSYKSIFVRMDGSDEIFSTKANFRSNIDKDEFGWKDKSIVTIPKEQITSVELLQKGASRVIVQNRDSLTMIYGEDSKKEPEVKGNAKATTLLGSFARLNTRAFHADTVANFAMPDLVAKVTQVGGASSALHFVKKDDTAYFIKLDGNKQVFEINKATADKFLKTYTDLKE